MAPLEDMKDVGKEAKRAARLWKLLDNVWGMEHGGNLMDGQITEIRIKRPAYPGGPTNVIVKGADDTGKFVGFSEGIDTPVAILGVLDRIKAGALKWREDRPWDPGAAYAKKDPAEG